MKVNYAVSGDFLCLLVVVLLIILQMVICFYLDILPDSWSAWSLKTALLLSSTGEAKLDAPLPPPP